MVGTLAVRLLETLPCVTQDITAAQRTQWPLAPALPAKVVHTVNEWDPLEEVIVGSVEGSMVPGWDLIERSVSPPGSWTLTEQSIGKSGQSYPPELVSKAEECLHELVQLLESGGVTVRRPGRAESDREFAAPGWKVPNGVNIANPRDGLLIFGDLIVEAPMADRGRYFETFPFRRLLQQYSERGARWISAPKPQLLDDLYNYEQLYHFAVDPTSGGNVSRFAAREVEPVFCAADFVRCGTGLIGQRSHVTNNLGIDWLRRNVPDADIHIVESRRPEAFRIDTSIMPMGPERILVNPEFIDVRDLPKPLSSWEILIAPEPSIRSDAAHMFRSKWFSMNLLMIDPENVLVERDEITMIRALERWGFNPVPCSFEALYAFGGSFHCATLDVRRSSRQP